jgi:hypothetical protein
MLDGSRYLCPVLTKTETCLWIKVTFEIISFHENVLVLLEFFMCVHMGVQTSMTKCIDPLLQLFDTNAPEIINITICVLFVVTILKNAKV